MALGITMTPLGSWGSRQGGALARLEETATEGEASARGARAMPEKAEGGNLMA